MTRLATPLRDWHAAHGGRLVDFAGWEMPVQYTSIVAEHQAVRTTCGMFDIAHMGRLRFHGDGALRFLESLLTNSVATLSPGQVRYSLVTNGNGGILDDVLIYRLTRGYLLVVNASNREKIVNWIRSQPIPTDVEMEDQTYSTFMLALQGKLAQELLQPFVPTVLDSLKYYYAAECSVALPNGVSCQCLVSRTGYTGEDGFEVITPAEVGAILWEALLASGQSRGLLPCGLGCRDTLRLEAAMPLYGHELDESLDPISAGLGFAVKLDGRQFPGRDVLAAVKGAAMTRKRVGLRLDGKRIAREKCPLFAGIVQVGEVTSGTFSPTLQQSIAMGYISHEHAAIGTPIQVEIRGARENAEVVGLPFYKCKK